MKQDIARFDLASKSCATTASGCFGAFSFFFLPAGETLAAQALKIERYGCTGRQGAWTRCEGDKPMQTANSPSNASKDLVARSSMRGSCSKEDKEAMRGLLRNRSHANFLMRLWQLHLCDPMHNTRQSWKSKATVTTARKRRRVENDPAPGTHPQILSSEVLKHQVGSRSSKPSGRNSGVSATARGIQCRWKAQSML